MQYKKHPHFRKRQMAFWITAALLPAGAAVAQQLDLVQGPPSSQSSSHVAPNVLLSLDDSGSMGGGVGRGGRGGGSSRIQVLRDALTETFSDTNLLPDGSIRLAWHVMNSNHPGYARLTPNSTADNAMRILDDTHRQKFLDLAARLPADGWTPTHGIVKAADDYFRNSALNENSPWASKPGTQGAPFLGCRRNYHILLTDGDWNVETDRVTSPANFDGTARNLPDGKSYQAVGPYADDQDGTIADWALYGWSVPLKNASDLDGDMKPDDSYTSAPAQETFTSRSGGSTATLDKYWNPKYNPATWSHLVTFTIGFSTDAIPSWLESPSSLLPYGYDGDFADFVNGTKKWNAVGRRAEDMWHAAINGRGQFYAVRQPDELKLAFTNIIQAINTTTAGSARGRVAASGSSRVRNDVGVFESFYDAGQSWLGGVMAQVLKQDGSYADAWGGKSTAELLDDKYPASADARTIISTNSTSPFSGQGIPFRFASLSQSQQGDLNGDADMVGYLRGDRNKEGTYRTRTSVQGDIVNSNIWYVQGAVSNYNFADYTSNKYLDFARDKQSRPAMIYVGGNDGMLHGFDAGTGEEKIAYVPNGVYPHLADLASTGYAHHYFVDGPGMTGDIYDGGGWKTVFVGALGAGAKGYYVLDVTDPGSFSEGNAARLVLLDGSFLTNFDCTAGCDVQDDIGHIFADPAVDGSNVLRALQIARLNDGRWAAILGNGLNSKNGNSVLLIQYLDGNREVLRVPAAASAGKTGGLGGPMPVDINGDGRPDVVYAGDNDGKLWKFDISSPDPGQWKVAFGGEPLFSLPAGPDPAASGHPNPITAAPLVRPAPGSVSDLRNSGASIALGGMMVAFGTGRNVTAQDRGDKTVQGIYSVLDNTRYKAKPHPRAGLGQVLEICTSTSDTECNITPDQVPAIVGKAQLAKQSFGTPNAGDDHWKVDQSVKIDWSTQKGWYLDLPEEGERLLRAIRPYENSDILSIFTQVPSDGGGNQNTQDESCDPAQGAPVTEGKQFQTMLHVASGQAAKQPLFDADGDGVYGTADEGYVRRSFGTQDLVMVRGPDAMETVPAVGSGGAGGGPAPINFLDSRPVRPSWRQVR